MKNEILEFVKKERRIEELIYRFGDVTQELVELAREGKITIKYHDKTFKVEDVIEDVNDVPEKNAGELILRVVEELKKRDYKIVGEAGYGLPGYDFMLMKNPDDVTEVPIKIFTKNTNETVLWLDDITIVVILNDKLLLVRLDKNTREFISFEQLVKEVIESGWLGSW